MIAKGTRLQSKENGMTPILKKNEVKDLIVRTLIDIYGLKTHLLGYLPTMASKAQYRELKLAIMDSSIDLKAQLLRLNMIMAILKNESLRDGVSESGKLNLKSYIISTTEELASFETDSALLIHLLMIESLQITSFRMLKKLAARLKNHAIFDLVDENLKDTLDNRRVLEKIMEDYTVK
jgi:ferritin-like metal-binding protein YciE